MACGNSTSQPGSAALHPLPTVTSDKERAEAAFHHDNKSIFPRKEKAGAKVTLHRTNELGMEE